MDLLERLAQARLQSVYDREQVIIDHLKQMQQAKDEPERKPRKVIPFKPKARG